MKRKIFAVMLSCALIGSLFGCGSDNETVVTNSDLIAEPATGSVTESTATLSLICWGKRGKDSLSLPS